MNAEDRAELNRQIGYQKGDDRKRGKGATGPRKDTIAKYWLSAKKPHKNPMTGITERMSYEDIITLKMIKKAMAGNVLAYKELMDRAYGKPKSAEENTNQPKVNIASFTWLLPDGEKRNLIIQEAMKSVDMQIAQEEEE